MRLEFYKVTRRNENQAGTAETPRISITVTERKDVQVRPMKALDHILYLVVPNMSVA